MVKAEHNERLRTLWSERFNYDDWMESIGIPIHRGSYIEDLRTLELGWWDERQCNAAFIQLPGQEGIISVRVTEIAPGKTLPPLKFALDEIVYVADGGGLTNIWTEKGRTGKTFEWQKHSMFMIPQNYWCQLSNMRGDKAVRLLHYNYLPLVLSCIRHPEFLFNNPFQVPDFLSDPDANFYSEARMIEQKEFDAFIGIKTVWFGNFFPNMSAWDKFDENARRGAGGRSVFIQFPDSEMSCHMSYFDAMTYKKAHRHGPGTVIVIPEGEGYSILWEEGKEKIILPWHEASVFTPPNKWFHQHFNVGASPAKYLALHAPRQFRRHWQKIEDRLKDQIEYPDEDKWIREKFEEELARRGLKSRMPDEVYQSRELEWSRATGLQT